MNRKTLESRIRELTSFCNCRKKKVFICSCSDEELHTLCELCYNIVFGNINLSRKKKVLRKLFKLREYLHFLADASENVQEKRIVFMDLASKLFPILRKYIIPSLRKQFLRRRLKREKKN